MYVMFDFVIQLAPNLNVKERAVNIAHEQQNETSVNSKEFLNSYSLRQV